MELTEREIKKVAEKILGYVPSNIKELHDSYEIYGGIIKLNIPKCAEQEDIASKYYCFKSYDKETFSFYEYNGPSITVTVSVLEKGEQLVKLNRKDFEFIAFVKKDKEADRNLEI